MSGNGPIDDVDREIIRGLFEDARRRSNEEIAEMAGVTQSTVSKRINNLEERGIIQSYYPQIDFEKSGYAMEFLFTCSAPISKRDEYIDEAFELHSVVEVRELMVGTENVHINVVGQSREDITKIAKEVDRIGFGVEREIMVRRTDRRFPESPHTL